MKKNYLMVPLTLLLVLMAVAGKTDAAAVCGEKSPENTSEVNLFFKNVQCTLEKAKPWVEEIEKEAKKLEESAKKFGEGVISKLSDLMEKWISGGNITSNITETDVKDEAVVVPVEMNEVGSVILEKCPQGQIQDMTGECKPVV